MIYCYNMQEVRDNIDRIDQEIVKLLGQRRCYIQQAARLKTDFEHVRDENRIEDVVRKVRTHAVRYGVNPDLIEELYRPMMDSFIDYEGVEFKRLRSEEAA